MALPRSIIVWPLCALLLAAAPALDIDPDVRAVLTRYLRFSAGEIADLQRGKVVRHGLDATASGEVAVAGAVRVNAPKAALLDRVRDIVRFKQGGDVLQIGRFSDPPILDDLAALVVDRDDFDPRSCRLGDCGVRLSADVIRRVPQEIDLRASDAQAGAEALFKQVLLDNVTAYMTGGAGRMAQFDDGPSAIRPVDELAGVLANMPSIGALLPRLPAHLKDFPSSRMPDTEDFLYWSKERFGAAPFITVTHVTIVCRSVQTCIVTTKDVYSSRYLDASLTLTIATDAGPGVFYLVYANRSRANALKGALGNLKRSIAGRRARSGLEEQLKTLKTQLEQS